MGPTCFTRISKCCSTLQLVIALVVTTDGLPLAYGVMKGHTSDRTTLPGFLKKMEDTYGKARRIWVMDHGVGGHTHKPDQPAGKEVAGFTVAQGPRLGGGETV